MAKKISMNVINPQAAGIDVGSRSHFVATGQRETDIREFGVYTEDQQQMIAWLKERRIKTIAMESTGSYWQTLFSALQLAGFEVMLVNGQQIKNVKGKTDVIDCKWIQRLHSMGLLHGSFLPSAQIEILRTYYRHRESLIRQCAKASNKMQKAMRLMNLRLDVVIKDINGKSGTAIIEAILRGERDGNKLSQLADPRVKKSKKEIAAALIGQWQPELLYELQDEYDSYCFYQQKIKAVDAKIQQTLLQMLPVEPAVQNLSKLAKRKPGKNQPDIQLPLLSYRYIGVNLFEIEGVKYNTVLAYLSEVGTDIHKFPTSEQFASWLRLAPNNKISGGKVISTRTPKGKNSLAQALRKAANTIANLKRGPLVSFFKRIAFKNGRAAAITATARKLAVIIWNMVTKKQPYRPMEDDIYKEKIKQSVIKNIKSKMIRLGITAPDLQ